MRILSVAHLTTAKKGIIFDCSLARRFWTGRFSVTHQSHVAGLVLQQLTVVFSCHELLFYLLLLIFPPLVIKTIARQQSLLRNYT